MDDIGIDLHKTSNRVCLLTEDGKPGERRIKTDRESFDKLFADRPSRLGRASPAAYKL